MSDKTGSAAASKVITWQSDLFTSLEPEIDVTFSNARRISLDETSWIEHIPGWLQGSERLFEELLATAPWEQRERVMWGQRFIEPRLTAEYDDIDEAPQPMLHAIADVLSEHYGIPYRKLWINQYKTHRDSTGWHGDLIAKVQEESTVPVLSTPAALGDLGSVTAET